jgi:signal transduction histidine kinase
MLHQFITSQRDQIIARCRERVSTRPQFGNAPPALNSGVPLFLDQLVATLQSPGQSSLEIATSAAIHGHDLLLQGLTVSQVVHEYGDVCQAVTELALEADMPINTADFRTLNRCLDDAIAGAVTVYGRESEQTRVDGEAARGNERLGFLAHELRNLINTAIVAFEVLKTGNVGVGGSTGAVLDRSLSGLNNLITRSLAEARFSAGIHKPERITVAELIRAVSQSATIEGRARGMTLTVLPIAEALTVEVDSQVLSAVIFNLLQNAFKFSQHNSTVTLSVGASAARVLIEVQDECGGLPGGDDSEALFRPFEQRSADRSGIGIGLAFCRWGAVANNRRLYSRNLPGLGCIFTVDLPRCPEADGPG